ncbi:hypothetical protein K8R62_00935 [bacterium]|nr:hypothetical protein [bacterium]
MKNLGNSMEGPDSLQSQDSPEKEESKMEILQIPDMEDEEFQTLKKQAGLTYLHTIGEMNKEEQGQYIQREKETLSEQIRDMDKNGYTNEHSQVKKNKAMIRALYELEN